MFYDIDVDLAETGLTMVEADEKFARLLDVLRFYNRNRVPKCYRVPLWNEDLIVTDSSIESKKFSKHIVFRYYRMVRLPNGDMEKREVLMRDMKETKQYITNFVNFLHVARTGNDPICLKAKIYSEYVEPIFINKTGKKIVYFFLFFYYFINFTLFFYFFYFVDTIIDQTIYNENRNLRLISCPKYNKNTAFTFDRKYSRIVSSQHVVVLSMASAHFDNVEYRDEFVKHDREVTTDDLKEQCVLTKLEVTRLLYEAQASVRNQNLVVNDFIDKKTIVDSNDENMQLSSSSHYNLNLEKLNVLNTNSFKFKQRVLSSLNQLRSDPLPSTSGINYYKFNNIKPIDKKDSNIEISKFANFESEYYKASDHVTEFAIPQGLPPKPLPKRFDLEAHIAEFQIARETSDKYWPAIRDHPDKGNLNEFRISVLLHEAYRVIIKKLQKDGWSGSSTRGPPSQGTDFPFLFFIGTSCNSCAKSLPPKADHTKNHRRYIVNLKVNKILRKCFCDKNWTHPESVTFNN